MYCCSFLDSLPYLRCKIVLFWECSHGGSARVICTESLSTWRTSVDVLQHTCAWRVQRSVTSFGIVVMSCTGKLSCEQCRFACTCHRTPACSVGSLSREWRPCWCGPDRGDVQHSYLTLAGVLLPAQITRLAIEPCTCPCMTL